MGRHKDIYVNTKIMSNMTYDDGQQATFCALAQEIGIGRAIRELGYPKSWQTGTKWMTARGIKPNLDTVMQQSKLWHTFYETEDMLEVIDEGMDAVKHLLLTCESADDLKKLAEALQKLANTRLLLEGKATTINEKRETTPVDIEIATLVAQHNKANEDKVKS